MTPPSLKAAAVGILAVAGAGSLTACTTAMGAPMQMQSAGQMDMRSIQGMVASCPEASRWQRWT